MTIIKNNHVSLVLSTDKLAGKTPGLQTAID